MHLQNDGYTLQHPCAHLFWRSRPAEGAEVNKPFPRTRLRLIPAMSNMKGNERNIILLIPFEKKNVVEKKKFHYMLLGFLFVPKQMKTPSRQKRCIKLIFCKNTWIPVGQKNAPWAGTAKYFLKLPSLTLIHHL